jgi:beta-phosphoglucomutase-like phosphatase (HAD superfamily)
VIEPALRQHSSFVFDLDGTLVDSVYQHVLAWHEAIEQEGLTKSGAVGDAGRKRRRSVSSRRACRFVARATSLLRASAGAPRRVHPFTARLHVQGTAAG